MNIKYFMAVLILYPTVLLAAKIDCNVFNNPEVRGWCTTHPKEVEQMWAKYFPPKTIEKILPEDDQARSPAEGATEKKNDCSNLPHSYPESGGCKCEINYLPNEAMHACIRRGLEGQAQTAFDEINKARALSTEKKKNEQKSLDTGRIFVNLELSDRLPTGVRVQKRKSHNSIILKTKEIVSEAEDKLRQAKEEYDKEKYSNASQLAQEAKALLLAIDDMISKSQCSLDTVPTVRYNGQRTVLVDLNLPQSGCSCRDFTFSLIRHRYTWKLLFWGNESTEVIKSVPACDVAQPDSFITIGEDFPGVGPGSFSKASGPMILWRTYTWLVGVLSPNPTKLSNR